MGRYFNFWCYFMCYYRLFKYCNIYYGNSIFHNYYINSCGHLVIWRIILLYLCVVSGYFYGKIYLKEIDKEPVNMGTKDKLLPTKVITTTNNKDLNLLNTYLLKARELPPKALNDFQNNNINKAIDKWTKSIEYYKKRKKRQNLIKTKN